MSLTALVENYIIDSNDIYIILDQDHNVIFANETAKKYFMLPKQLGQNAVDFIELPEFENIFSANSSYWKGELAYHLDKKEEHRLNTHLSKILDNEKNTFYIFLKILYQDFSYVTLASLDQTNAIDTINSSLNNILISLNKNVVDYTNENTPTTKESKNLKLNKIQSNLESIRYFFRELTSDVIINYGSENFTLFHADVFVENVIHDMKSEKKESIRVHFEQKEIELVGIKFKLNYVLKRILYYIFQIATDKSFIDINIKKDYNRNQIVFSHQFMLNDTKEMANLQSILNLLPLVKEITQTHNGKITSETEEDTLKCTIQFIIPNQYNLLTELPVQISLINFETHLKDKICYCIKVISSSIVINRLEEKEIRDDESKLSLSDLIFIKFDAGASFDSIKEMLNHRYFEKKQLLVSCEPIIYYENENYFIEQNIGLLRIPIEKKDLIREIKKMIYLHRQMDVLTKSIAITKKEAITDGLTGLFNRRYLAEYIHNLENIMPAKNESFSIIMGDIDNFKDYNDNNGHILGDSALKAFANLITKTVRVSDQVIRYGGEEFIIFLKGSDKKTGCSIAEKLRRAVEEYYFENEENQPLATVTASFGVSSFPTDESNIDELISIADKRLYKAKELGRNRIVCEDGWTSC